MNINTLYLTTLVDNKTKQTISASDLVSGSGSAASKVAYQSGVASDATAATVATAFNSLLIAMQTAGVMAVS